MRPSDVAMVLAKASAFDRRTVGEMDVAAWYEAIGDLELGDCLEAVARHYRASTDWLMPAHVRDHADDVRQVRLLRDRQATEALALEAPQRPSSREESVRDRTAAVTAFVLQLRDRLTPSDPAVFRRSEWVEAERQRRREAKAEPNSHFCGLPPEGGYPVPDPVSEETA